MIVIGQTPDRFRDGIRTEFVQPDTLSTMDRDNLTPKLGTILYHKDVGISQWEEWDGTDWVEFGSITIDPTIIDGSPNAVAGGAVFDEFALKQDVISEGNGININTNEISVDSARVAQKDFGSINVNGIQFDWGNRAYLDGLPDPPTGVDRLEIEVDGADPGNDFNFQQVILTDLTYDTETNIEVIPAPGLGKVIVVDRVLIKSNITSVYTPAGTNPFLYLGWDAPTYKEFFLVLHTNDYTATGKVWKYNSSELPNFSSSSSTRVTDLENIPMTVSLRSTGTSISGGAGTIEINVWYVIENL